MGIFKRPKFLIVGGAVFLAAFLLTVSLVFLLQPKTVGFYGLDRQDEETVRLQELLEENGYTVYYAETLEDLHNTNCKAWVVRATSDIFTQKILDIVGDKAIFIDSKPSLAQPIRFVGWNVEEAGALFGQLLSKLPNQGDTNEDGTLSCLILTAPEGYREKADWVSGLEQAMAGLQLPYEILDVCSCTLSEEAGMEATLESLSTYGRDIEVILASSETLAEGAAQAIKEGGWLINKDFYLLANGHTDVSLNALTQLQRSGLVFANWADFDSLFLSAIEDTIAGKAPQEYLLPLKLYTSTSSLQ